MTLFFAWNSEQSYCYDCQPFSHTIRRCSMRFGMYDQVDFLSKETIVSSIPGKKASDNVTLLCPRSGCQFLYTSAVLHTRLVGYRYLYCFCNSSCIHPICCVQATTGTILLFARRRCTSLYLHNILFLLSLSGR